MDSTMARVTLVAALLVLVAALGALVSRPDFPLGQDDVEFEILGGTLISGSPGAGAGPVAQSDRVAARPPGSSGDSGQPGSSQAGPGGPPGQQPDGGPPGPPASPPPGQPTIPPGRSFGIAGDVGAFYPGVDTVLTLTIHNPQAFAIEVTELTIEAFDAETCSASVVGFKLTHKSTYAWKVLTFEPASPIVVESRSSEAYDVHITLENDSVTDACRLAEFDLAYEGKAVRP